MTLFAGAPLRTIEFVMVGADASFPGGTERCVSAEGEESSVNERLAAIVRLRLGGWDVHRGQGLLQGMVAHRRRLRSTLQIWLDIELASSTLVLKMMLPSPW